MSDASIITAGNFEAEVENATLPVHAEWCGTCKMLGTIIEEVAAEGESSVKTGKVDTEVSAAVAARFGITSIPCLILFKNGKEIDRRIGASSKDNLLVWLDRKTA